jgi:Divergent InlB B-repeat domain
MTRTALVAFTAALALASPALAGGIRMHVSGSGGGTIAIWPYGQQPCRDGGGGLIFQATPDPGSTFDGWPYPGCYLYPGGYCQTGGPQGASCCSDLYVSFSKLRYTLSVGVTGTGKGSVVSAPAGIDCGTACTGTFDWNSSVTLTPQPAPGSRFSAWTGACAGSGPCTVSLTAAASVTAVFDLDSFPLAVSKTGSGRGIVTSTPAGIDCGDRCSAPFVFGSSVTLSAVAATGSHFADWTGACSGTGACAPTVSTGSTAVNARFEVVTVTAHLRRRTLSLALYAERASKLVITLTGPSRFTTTLTLSPGPATPALILPKRLRPGHYTARFNLRDTQGSAMLRSANLQLHSD